MLSAVSLQLISVPLVTRYELYMFWIEHKVGCWTLVHKPC